MSSANFFDQNRSFASCSPAMDSNSKRMRTMAAESEDEQCYPYFWSADDLDHTSHSIEATPEKAVITCNTDQHLYLTELANKDGAEQFDLDAIYFQLLCTRLNSASKSSSSNVQNTDNSSPTKR